MPVTPLLAIHEDLGARLTDFGGWQMPLQYDGVISEHMAVRNKAGVFDISHLGRFAVSGRGSTDLLRSQLCNDITKIGPGRAQYTMALNSDGGVVDDVISWCIGEDQYWIIPNGVNSNKVMNPFISAAPDSVNITEMREGTVLLAIQGPSSTAILKEVLGLVPKRFRVEKGEFGGVPCWVAGTGYTGESGVEVAIPVGAGSNLFRAILEAGAVPCGLGARDTLRLEMGYPLWGQDLDDTTSPLEAGLAWVVSWNHRFTGRAALRAERERGINKELVAFKTAGRRIPRRSYPLRCGGSVGQVTSGNFSPVLGCGIGMGYLTPPPIDDAPMEVSVRETWYVAERVTLPFIEF